MFTKKENDSRRGYQVSDNQVGIRNQVVYGYDIRKTPYIEDKGNVIIRFPDCGGYSGFPMSMEVLSKHLLMIGGIGSGKTNTFYHLIDVVNKRMTSDDIMFIFDTKGDYKERFYDPDNRNHILIGNSADYRDVTCTWDIFGELKSSDGRIDENESMLIAKEISKQLFHGRESSRQPFFAEAGADIVSKLLIHMTRHPEKYELSTKRLVDFMKEATHVTYHNMLYNEPDFRSATNYMGVKTDKSMGEQGNGVMATINSMMNDLFIGAFAEDYGKERRISMRNLVRQKGRKIVFIEYDISVGEVLGPMYSILIDLALKEALGGRNKRGNVYFFVDEASLLPNLSHLQDALNYGRSLGVKVFAGLQSVAQFYDAYGKEKGEVLLAGFMNSFCFQTWDAVSREFISKRFGSNYQNISYIYGGQNVVLQREGKVVEDWDIMSLGVGEAYIGLTEDRPVMFRYKFPKY